MVHLAAGNEGELVVVRTGRNILGGGKEKGGRGSDGFRVGF